MARLWWESISDPRLRYGGSLLTLIALYYGAAHVGYAFSFAGPVASIVWLPVGVAITFLYLGGIRYWPGVLIGDLLVNNYAALPVGVALGQTFGNVLEAVAAAFLLTQFARRRPLLGTPTGVVLMVIALGVGTAVSATVGSVSLFLGHAISAGSLPGIWRAWWLGDLGGGLLVLPLVLVWSRPDNPRWQPRQWIELIAGLTLVAGLSVLAINSISPVTMVDKALSSGVMGYLVFPALIWNAVRLGLRGATVSVAVGTGFGIWATTHYLGPFHSHLLARTVLETQLFIFVASLSSLCLAAVVEDRARIAEGLLASHAKATRAADAERRRLERNLHDGAQQRLSSLMVRLDVVAETAQQEPRDVGPVFDALKSELAVALEELRELARGSHPPALVQHGLAAAVVRLVEGCPIPVVLGELPTARLPDRTETTVYYVIAEALANAQKHSHASRVNVHAVLTGGCLRVEVADDGVGGADQSGGSGLNGLQDRIAALGGSLEVDSPPGRGTKLKASIPVTTR